MTNEYDSSDIATARHILSIPKLKSTVYGTPVSISHSTLIISRSKYFEYINDQLVRVLTFKKRNLPGMNSHTILSKHVFDGNLLFLKFRFW